MIKAVYHIGCLCPNCRADLVEQAGGRRPDDYPDNRADLLHDAHGLSLEALGVLFKLTLLDRAISVDEKVGARALGLDPRVWRRNRAELETAGLLFQPEIEQADAA